MILVKYWKITHPDAVSTNVYDEIRGKITPEQYKEKRDLIGEEK